MAVNDIVMGAAGASAPATYIEDVFSTYLYTGNGSTQTITNGIDLSGKGGLVWNKKRSAVDDHYLWDTVRPIGSYLSSNLTNAQGPTSTGRIAYSSTGFSWQAGGAGYNESGQTYASWTFRKQPKFFDIVTYTGTGANTTIPHNLGSVPGCIITKCTSAAGDDWATYHRSTGASQYLVLNTIDASTATSTGWNNTAPTSTVFSLGTSSLANGSGKTYVAYVFAHNAGGFGLTGTDNVISCGSFSISSGVDSTVNLGYEPQWLMIKKSTAVSDWRIIDNMRGMVVSTSGTDDANLYPNTSGVEALGNVLSPTATGFVVPTTSTIFDVGSTYIYIAIRRPMKTPTTGTSVFSSVAASIPNSAYTVTTGFPVDMSWSKNIDIGYTCSSYDRLRGKWAFLSPTETSAEAVYSTPYMAFDSNTKIVDNYNWIQAYNGPTAYWNFRRAAGFFDVVCYTGNGTAGRTVNHNLTVAPELMIVKSRSVSSGWYVYVVSLGATKGLVLNTTAIPDTYSGFWNNTSPTSSVFSTGAHLSTNQSGDTYVAYLFATVAGVSKVGSYTGNGTTQTINCGFTTGARFVLIKRTDSTGDWYVWDSTRGIVAGNDPHLSLNTTAAEVTTDDSVDAASSGFIVNQLAATNINVTSATYIFLAIA